MAGTKHSARLPRATATWKLEDAKARFSEVVRLARERGPQRVTVRGRDAVVVLASEEYARLAPAASSGTFAALIADSPLARIKDLDRTLLRERAPMRKPLDLSA